MSGKTMLKASTRKPFLSNLREQAPWALFLLPALLVYVVFMAAPLFDSLRLSLYTGEGYTPTQFVGLQNYIDLFTNPLWRARFTGAFWHTCIFFAVHMLVQNCLGMFFANLLSSDFK